MRRLEATFEPKRPGANLYNLTVLRVAHLLQAHYPSVSSFTNSKVSLFLDVFPETLQIFVPDASNWDLVRSPNDIPGEAP